MPAVVEHDQRIAATVAAFEAAMARFLVRIENASDAEAERTPPGGGWSVAGIAWHVAVTNERFAGLVDGSVPLAVPPGEGFEERPFDAIAADLPDRLEAPEPFHPPADVTKASALELARASQAQLVRALRDLPASRAAWTIKSILGRLTVYQVGEWAVAHVARHNAQAKRQLLG